MKIVNNSLIILRYQMSREIVVHIYLLLFLFKIIVTNCIYIDYFGKTFNFRFDINYILVRVQFSTKLDDSFFYQIFEFKSF